MPICKRDGFDNAPSKNNKDETFHDNEEVFFCEVTKEIFREYEDYFRHVMVINSTVWQCEATGRENLTYAEALKSERRAKKKMELFKDSLRPPVMLVIEHAKQSSMKSLDTIVAKFLRRRFFLNEKVTACNKSTTYFPYTVVEVVPPEEKPPANGVYEETENLKYKLRRVDAAQKEVEVIVPYENIRRLRLEFTTENLHMFIKYNVTRVDGILKPKPESYKQYVTDRKITFASVFIGKMPHFTPAKIKRQTNGIAKKQSTMNKYLLKNGEQKIAPNKPSQVDVIAKIQRDTAKAEAKAKSLQEQMDRLRKERQAKTAEQERLRLEKRAKLWAKVDKECISLLSKSEDLDRSDQRMIPTFTPINTYISKKLLGDAFVVREFMHSFSYILSGMEVFRGNLSFYEMSRALTVREVAGPLSDILLIFLGTIFDLQREEEEECSVDYLMLRKEIRQKEPFRTMSYASYAHFFSKRHLSFKINELPIDALTLSEVLRLHLLSSGAAVRDRAEKWRLMYRNGYTSTEDPGLTLRMQQPHILRALQMYTVYQLPFIDIMRILQCLCAQILTYSSAINHVEERMDEFTKARTELRVITAVENRRLGNVQNQRRTLTNEHNQQCLADEVKNDSEKKQALEEKLNKKIAEVLAQSDREHRKYEQQAQTLKAALFNYMVYLGMDRAYRKYYVLESMPGIFVEHPTDCMDTCLDNPPKNTNNKVTAHTPNLPKNRKDLRSYLLRVFLDEEKKLVNDVKKEKGVTTASQEDKENQENQMILGLTNGHDTDVANGVDKSVPSSAVTAVAVKAEEVPEPSQTQYQLYMCTGDPRNCIVHDERNVDRQQWAYLYEKEDIDALIESLNPLGERESYLREQLTSLRLLILSHVKKCPASMLSLDSKQMKTFKSCMMNDTYRKYNKSNFGYPEGSDLNEVMYTAMVNRILLFENEIYTGDLGRLKVKDMEKWRTDLQNNTYDPQGNLHWGPNTQKWAISAPGEEEDVLDEVEYDDTDGGQHANKPYQDPGEGLGDTMEIDSEDSEDEGISLHDSTALRTTVKNLSSALLQVEQSIERRFIKEPFGASATLKENNKELLERKIKISANRLKQWEVSLMQCSSYSQVFLHLNVLHDSILWTRSTNKSICQVCRRGSDPDKMLLCDECNGGTHMFCMKPKMRTVPEGNWYCGRCVKRLGIKDNESETKSRAGRTYKRAFNYDEEENESVSDISNESSKSDTKTNGRRAGNGRRSKKEVHSNEIEEMLEEGEDGSDDNGEDVDDVDVDDDDDGGDADADSNEDNVDDAVEEEEDTLQSESEDVSDQDEDEENICIVCSYNGSELICIRCKDTFHLECINLKRPPRYNFICAKCKTGEDKKRKIKANDDSCDDDDDEDAADRRVKRSRQQRPARTSLPNGQSTSQETKPTSNGRRSNRRTGDNLPLNSSLLYKLLEDIMKHEQSWPFLRPVMQSEVPDYYEIIRNPMNLAKVKSKLNMGEYQINEELMNDIHLIFKNCDQYNAEGNEIYQAGCALEKYVIERCKDLNLPFKPSDMNDE